MRLNPIFLLICMTSPSLVVAQTNDASDAQLMEAERQRLGNQRIQQDMEWRAREEEERRLAQERQQAARSRGSAQQENAGPQEAAPTMTESDALKSQPAPPGAGSNNEMSRLLEQLRILGELKDAGYITEQEHKKIKQKILDDLT